MNYIEERLVELEEEKKELQKYDDLDKTKRRIEYNLYQSQLYSAEANLEKIDNMKLEENKENAGAYDAVSSKQALIKQKDRELKQATMELNVISKDKEALNTEIQELITQKTKLDIRCNEETSLLKSESDNSSLYKSELKKLETKIEKAKKDLDKVTDEYKNALQKERNTEEKLNNCETKLNSLYSKMGRSAQYSNRKERDNAIKEELKSLNNTINEKKKQTEIIQEAIRELIQNVKEKSQKRNEKEAALAKAKTELDSLMTQCTNLRNQRDTFANERKLV